ncbi:hypothetical protein PRZ48_006517 [Zasmidium cellare]|uniref:Bromo domain-containing protein n=1 Tax=Zasmidium cellare TaxID=395010 RepID=A0ABR0ENN0_ZASCE|nr:hypothetical protein PRZ48_006517 [Zasmidium cellare]
MDVEKAARAFRASLVNDLHKEYEEDAAQIRAQYDEKMAILKTHLNRDLASLDEGLEDDPVKWVAKYYPKKSPAGTAEPATTGRKRDRSPETNGAVIPGIDGAADDEQPAPPPPPPKSDRPFQKFIAAQGTDGRPKRTARRAPSKDYEDIVAADTTNREPPARTQPQQEQTPDLLFAAHILTNLCNPHLHTINRPFLAPVSLDECPDYNTIIPQPMDLETMSVKLSNGRYTTASDLKSDFELMIANCNEYNPQNHPIRECGIRLRRHFEEWWNGKERWERALAREQEKAREEAEEDDSEDEEEVDELLLDAVPTGDREVDERSRRRLEEEIARCARREGMGKEKRGT